MTCAMEMYWFHIFHISYNKKTPKDIASNPLFVCFFKKNTLFNLRPMMSLDWTGLLLFSLRLWPNWSELSSFLHSIKFQTYKIICNGLNFKIIGPRRFSVLPVDGTNWNRRRLDWLGLRWKRCGGSPVLRGTRADGGSPTARLTSPLAWFPSSQRK